MKNIITMNEREIIFDNMTDILCQYNYHYTTDAINKIIDTWAEQKADLIALFKKHPNYVKDQLLIAFNQDWNRAVDENGACRFSEWMWQNRYIIFDNLPDDIKKQIATWMDEHPWRGPVYLPRKAHFLYDYYSLYAKQLVDEDALEYFNGIDPSIRFTKGMKMSRAINKICTYFGINKLPDYNKEFAKYADSVNPLKITRHTIISINPVDYLTMSFGNSWASCHTIDKENTRDMPNAYHGQYSSGTISYMLDKVSMVFYTVDAEYSGDMYYFQSKINRCMFHYGKDKLIQGRVYPQDNDRNADGIYKDIREIVQRVLTTCLDIPNYWDTKRGCETIGDYICTEGTHYPDYHHFSNCAISFPKGLPINENTITIGHNPICIDCGCEHDDGENINHCANNIECANCGCIVDQDDAHYIHGEWYCDDCSYYCVNCDEYYERDDVHWVDEADGYVCDDCIEDDYIWCDECERYHRDYNTRYLDNYGRNVCDRCLRDNYTQCDHCGDWVRDENVNEDAQCNSYCDSCWEAICVENENEEEAM